MLTKGILIACLLGGFGTATVVQWPVWPSSFAREENMFTYLVAKSARSCAGGILGNLDFKMSRGG